MTTSPYYWTMPLAQLRDLCRQRGLRESGPAVVLIARLEIDDEAQAEREAEWRA